jgi:hypothetical protein
VPPPLPRGRPSARRAQSSVFSGWARLPNCRAPAGAVAGEREVTILVRQPVRQQADAVPAVEPRVERAQAGGLQDPARGGGHRGRSGPARARVLRSDGPRDPGGWVSEQRLGAPASARHDPLPKASHAPHSYASMLIEAGEPLTYVQQRLGHHSAAFTLKAYGHLLPRGDRRAVDGLDDTTSRNPAATEVLSR